MDTENSDNPLQVVSVYEIAVQRDGELRWRHRSPKEENLTLNPVHFERVLLYALAHVQKQIQANMIMAGLQALREAERMGRPMPGGGRIIGA